MDSGQLEGSWSGLGALFEALKAPALLLAFGSWLAGWREGLLVQPAGQGCCLQLVLDALTRVLGQKVNTLCPSGPRSLFPAGLQQWIGFLSKKSLAHEQHLEEIWGCLEALCFQSKELWLCRPQGSPGR